MHQNEYFFFDFVFADYDEKSWFYENVKNTSVFALFQLSWTIRWKKCPRRVFFAVDYESRLLSLFAPLTAALAPSWAPWSLRYIPWLGFVALCRRLLLKMCISSRQNAYFYVSLRILNLLFLEKVCFSEAQNGLKPCFLTQMLKLAFLAACRSFQTQHYSFSSSKSSQRAFRRGETLVFPFRF